jgi:hypothetical protein
MARLMLAVLFGALLLVGGLACARGGHADAEVLAIAMNEDQEARPRLAFYAGVPGQDSFPLPPGTYDIIMVDAAGALSTVSWTLASGEDADASMLAAWELPHPSEEAGRLNRDAMRNLFLFFARFDEAQAQLEGIVTEGQTKPLPTSPDDLTAVQVMGEESPQGRVSGLRDWEAEIVPSGRLLELALAAIEGELPPSWDDLNGPFTDAQTLVREWRDGDAAERRAFVTVVGEMSAEQRAELHKHVVEVFGEVVPKSEEDFYRRVETGELDSEMWTIANYCYDDRLGNDGQVYRRTARSQGLEPGRSYYERWLQQEPSTWGFQWSVSEEAAEQAHLPAEVLRVSSEPAATLELEVGPE